MYRLDSWYFPHMASLCFVFYLYLSTNMTVMLCDLSCSFPPKHTVSMAHGQLSQPLHGLCCASHCRPCVFHTLFISVNHIRLHATCSCYLVLMVTGVVMRGEMREWWMVIVVLLLLSVWLGSNITSPLFSLCLTSVDIQGLLWVLSDLSVCCCFRAVVMKTNSKGWALCCWTPGVSCSILI